MIIIMEQKSSMEKMMAIMLMVMMVGAAVVTCAQVTVSGGHVEGTLKQSRKGRDYHSFMAIPYAQPPIGENRFMPTIPGFEWEGVLDATKPGEPCAQAALGVVAGVEDCLNLYVYTPMLPESGRNVSLPVVVWLHGGSFVIGGAASLDPSFIMDRNVVLVTPQYRLGFLGFFTTETGHAPGNMGMLDQVAALHWVRNNIAAFGGDPTQITLAGDCAGGASALYHMISPLSTGLFHRVLSLSGSPLSPWAFLTRFHRFKLILANYIKCPAYDQELLVQCFQEIEVDELLEGTQMLIEARDLLVGNHRLSPSLQEPAHSHETTLFLPQHPLRAMTRGDLEKVPVLLGVTRDVGSYLVDMMLYDFIQFRLEDNPGFLKELLVMLIKESNIRPAEPHEDEFKEFYFPNNRFDNLTTMLPGLANMLGDIHYKAGILGAATLLADHVPTRVFRFDYNKGPKLFDIRYPDPSEAPPMDRDYVGHGDEMALILPDTDVHLTPDQVAVSESLLDVLENYAHGRLPRSDWPVFSSEGHQTLVWEEDGGVTVQPFSTPERIAMLQNINSYLHEHVIEKMHEDENVHDEL